MLKCLIYDRKAAKNEQKWPYLDSRFCIKRARSKRYPLPVLDFFHDIFKINLELNFALYLLLKTYLAAKFSW